MTFDGLVVCLFFFFKQKTAYEMRISDWSSDVCSSDLREMALVLTDPEAIAEPQIYAVVRLSADPDNESAEYAVIVRDDMTGRGLGEKIGRASCRERVCQYV